MTRDEMPEGILVCRNKKGEDGTGHMKCVTVTQMDKILDTQKCPVQGD